MELPDQALSTIAVPTTVGPGSAPAAPAAASALATDIPTRPATLVVAPTAPAPHATPAYDAWGGTDAQGGTPPLPPHAADTLQNLITSTLGPTALPASATAARAAPAVPSVSLQASFAAHNAWGGTAMQQIQPSPPPVTYLADQYIWPLEYICRPWHGVVTWHGW